jgi:hypothetical protein
MHDPDDMPACLRLKSASGRTVKKYLKSGYRRLECVLADLKLEADDHGNPAALEEMVRVREACAIVLAKNTINVYRAEYRAVLRDLVERSLATPHTAEKAFERISAALVNQAKDVDKLPRRTARLKARDVKPEQRLTLLKGLAREARAGNKKAALVGLTIYLIATFSVRPREALLVRLDGDGLRFPILKQRQKVVRRFGSLRETRRFGEAWHKGVAAYIAAIKEHSETPEALDVFYDALSTKLMYVCNGLELPRLCFSVLRHVAASEFRAAGVSPQMLAQALGHKTTRTQHIYGDGVRDAHPRAIPESEIVVDLDFDAETASEASAAPRAPEIDEVQERAPLSTEIPATAVPPAAPESGVVRGTLVEQVAAPQPVEAPLSSIDGSEENPVPETSVAPAPQGVPQRARPAEFERIAAEDEHKRVATGPEAQRSGGRLNGGFLAATIRDVGRWFGQLRSPFLGRGTAGTPSAPPAVAPASALEVEEAGEATCGNATVVPEAATRLPATGTDFGHADGLAAPDPRSDGLAGSAALPSPSPRPMLLRPPLRETPVADPTARTEQAASDAQATAPEANEANIEDEGEDETPSFRM